MSKKCKMCDNIIPSSIMVDGTRKILSSRKYCLECSPYGLHNTKVLHNNHGDMIDKKSIIPHKKCNDCGIEDNDKFYTNHANYCKVCYNQQVIKKARIMKERAVSYKGGCCELCGYNKCIASLEFHHIDPSEKDSDSRNLRYWKWERVVIEIDKCILVCANCHREIHDELWNTKISKRHGVNSHKNAILKE